MILCKKERIKPKSNSRFFQARHINKKEEKKHLSSRNKCSRSLYESPPMLTGTALKGQLHAIVLARTVMSRRGKSFVDNITRFFGWFVWQLRDCTRSFVHSKEPFGHVSDHSCFSLVSLALCFFSFRSGIEFSHSRGADSRLHSLSSQQRWKK